MLNRMCLLGAALLVLCSCATSNRKSGGYYKVKVAEGESLAEIATRFDTSWQQIVSDNNLDSAASIQPGMKLIVRPGPGGYIAGARINRSPAGTTKRVKGAKKRGLFFGGGDGEASTTRFQWPLNGALTSKYGRRGWRQHHGIDIDGVKGEVVRAIDSGEVTFAGRQRGYGLIVILDHGDFSSRYAHLSRITVRRGQMVSKGREIGRVGRTGNATGTHLHFELRDSDDDPVNPLDYLPPRNLLSSR